MRNFRSIIFLITISAILPAAFGQSWQAQTIDPGLPRAATVGIGDIDGDKDPDVAASSFGEGKIVWYENSLSNQIWSQYIIDDSLPGAWGVQVADIDNDNKMDVVAAGNNVHDVVWYKNEGGAPIEWTKSVIDSSVFAQVVCVADIDDDKDMDVVVTAVDADGIAWYENSDLIWIKRSIGDLDGAVCLELLDMDGDLDLDVVATSFLGCKVLWFENNLPNHNWVRHIIDDFLPAAWGLDVADIDGDTDPDVAATSLFSDHVVWYENNQKGLPVWKEHIIDANLDGARYLSVVDMDMDKDPDLVVAGYESDLVVSYENDLPHASWIRDTIDANLNGANDICTTDLNGDTYPDLIATGWFVNRLVWYRNSVVGIEPLSGSLPTNHMLSQNYPNPFNPTTTIEFSIPQSNFVTLKIYSMLGEEVATLISEKLTAGSHKYDWNASGLASGVYMYRIQAGDYVESKKMVLLR